MSFIVPFLGIRTTVDCCCCSRCCCCFLNYLLLLLSKIRRRFCFCTANDECAGACEWRMRIINIIIQGDLFYLNDYPSSQFLWFLKNRWPNYLVFLFFLYSINAIHINWMYNNKWTNYVQFSEVRLHWKSYFLAL